MAASAACSAECAEAAPRSFAAPVLSARLLVLRALLLRGDAAFLRGARRLRRDAFLRYVLRSADDLGQAFARVDAIARLVAKAAGLDHEHAVGGQPAVAAREQPGAQRLWQH